MRNTENFLNIIVSQGRQMHQPGGNGYCVHRPHQAEEPFLHYLQPIFITFAKVIYPKLQVICPEILRDLKGLGALQDLKSAIKNYHQNRAAINLNHSKSPVFASEITQKNSQITCEKNNK